MPLHLVVEVVAKHGVPSILAIGPSGLPEAQPRSDGGRSEGRRRLVLPRVLLTAILALGSIPTEADAQPPRRPRSTMPLGGMTYEEVERVGAVGAGCTWKMGKDPARRMSMAKDRAAVMRKGSVVVLKPTDDAKPLFLTYDRWEGHGMYVVISDTNHVVRRGREFSETQAELRLTDSGRTSSFAGRLNCGS